MSYKTPVVIFTALLVGLLVLVGEKPMLIGLGFALVPVFVIALFVIVLRGQAPRDGKQAPPEDMYERL